MAENSSEELHINRLKALEILPEDFDINAAVTRGEMADIVCRIYGMDYMIGSEQVFSDVTKDHPYSAGIETAYQIGVISGTGAGKFEPDEPITNIQMIKMLTAIAGYEQHAIEYGGYPSGYMRIATDNDLIAPDTLQDGEVTGSALVYSVYHALEMPVVYIDSYKYGYMQYVVDDSNTLMQNLLNKKELSYRQGIMNFNGITYINKSDDPDEGYVEINGERFSCDADIRGLLGQSVEYWVNNDDVVVYAYGYKNRNTVYNFKSEDIDSAGFDKYVVYVDGINKKNIRLDKSINVIYNGQGLESFSEAELLPANGNVTLIDNDNDNYIEIVIVSDKKYYVVDEVSRGGLSVRYKRYGAQTQSGYTLKDEEVGSSVYYIVYDENGNKMTPEYISAGSVISVAESPNGKYINVTVTKKKIDGKVESINGKKIKINGTVYDFVNNLKDEYMDIGVRVGQTTQAYLNENGEIVYCDEIKNSDTLYAYVIDYWLSDNGETYYIRAAVAGGMGTLTNRKYWWVNDKLVQNSGVFIYEIDEKAKIDDVRNTPALIEGIQSKVCEIKIKDNDDEDSDAIITKITTLKPQFQYTKGKYNHNTGALIQPDLSLANYDNPAMLLSGNIKTLVIPSDASVKYSKECYEAKYRIENDVSTHNVAAYDIPKDSQTPKLIVMKTVLSEAGTAGGDSETCILTEDICSGIDDNNDDIYTVQAYNKDGNESELIIRSDVTFADSSIKNDVMTLCAGDVIEINRDGQNRVMDIKVNASASNPIDGTQMGVVEKLQSNVIWNKSNGDDFYNVFYYINTRGERVEAGIKADYPIFCYRGGKRANVEKISPSDVIADEQGIDADTVIIAGDIAVILPVD